MCFVTFANEWRFGEHAAWLAGEEDSEDFFAVVGDGEVHVWASRSTIAKTMRKLYPYRS